MGERLRQCHSSEFCICVTRSEDNGKKGVTHFKNGKTRDPTCVIGEIIEAMSSLLNFGEFVTHDSLYPM